MTLDLGIRDKMDEILPVNLVPNTQVLKYFALVFK